MNNKNQINHPQVKKNFQKSKSLINKLIEKIQLTALYIYAIIFQLYTIKSIFGNFPEHYYDLIPFLKSIFENRFLKFLGSPEKSFILYLLITEFTVFRPIAPFSILVKFNILYIFILELIQNLLYYCIDFFLANDFETVFVSKDITMKLVWNIYIFFLIIYLYSYYRAIRGRFPKFHGVFQKIIDSIAFWLRVKRVKKIEEENLQD